VYGQRVDAAQKIILEIELPGTNFIVRKELKTRNGLKCRGFF
jgi:hypothetical protein